MRLFPLGVWAVSTAGETTCALVEDDETRLMVDVGINPAFSLTRQAIPLTSITHVFLSHSHSDHMQGFANLVFTRDSQQRQYGPAAPLRVISTQANIHNAQELLKIFYPERNFEAEWIEVAPGDNVSFGNNELGFVATEHTVPGLGLIIYQNSQKLLAFTSDTALSSEMLSACSGAHTILGECFGTRADFGVIAERLKHLCAEDLAELAAESDARQVVPFHMHAPYVDSNKRGEMLTLIQSRIPGTVIDPWPGQWVDIN